ncbi:hypothetical protein OUZ56_006836 [Daphnia magna]|uniref:EGF-like domain-containing protein n=1 Tax=Daphnia magna TaxID=35525 RepID=A0ABQ9YWW0_9CRUS|nr:hypothetical protein OUZ56_006836 [Daphnia magna]
MESTNQGVRVSQFDMCVQHDPCQHGGICINTDTGPVCECRNLDYDGPFCEKGKRELIDNIRKY